MEQDDLKKSETNFLGELFVDPGILSGDSDQCQTEVGKRAVDIYWRFETDPLSITFGDLQDLTTSEYSQIGNKGNFLKHISTTAGVFRSLTIALEKKNHQLVLPHPDFAYVMGLVHDLNATFSDYDKGGQQSKEFDEFLLAKRLGWQKMAEQVAMHSDYLGVIRLMSQGANFPKQEAYGKMTKMLQGKSPYSYKAIEKEFAGFIAGQDRLSLMLLTVAENIATDHPYFNPAEFDENFEIRSGKILHDYHGKAVEKGKIPSLLGQALVNGGMERIRKYKKIVSTLLGDQTEEMDRLRLETKFFK